VGGTLSFGAALALGFAEGGALAESGMRIDVPGLVSITARNDSVLNADAVSGQQGTENNPAGDPVSEEIEEHVEGLLALAGQPELPDDILRILQRASAETADGAIGAAAAAAVNLDFGFVEAGLADTSDLDTDTSPFVQASGNMDAGAFADASTVDSATGVGVAVAINVDSQRVESRIGGDLIAPSVSISTGMDPFDENRFEAQALSGAGAEDIAVAGAFAINLSGDPRNLEEDLEQLLEGDANDAGLHIARIADGANITLTTASPVNITADYDGRYIANATADLGGGTIAIGPSVAINAVTHRTLAELGAATITGEEPGDGATDVNVTATGEYDTDTTADAGAVGNDGTLPAAIALTATSNDTIARVRPGEAQSTISGNLVVTATHVADTDTLADAESGGTDVGLGVAIAAGGPLGGARAEAGANMIVAGDVSALAETDSTVSADAIASQLGVSIDTLTNDTETDRQLRRLAEIAGVEDILFPFVDPHPPLQALFNAETGIDGAADTIRVLAPRGFDLGDAVRYQNNEDDTSLANLVDGDTYFISFDANDPLLLQPRDPCRRAGGDRRHRPRAAHRRRGPPFAGRRRGRFPATWSSTPRTSSTWAPSPAWKTATRSSISTASSATRRTSLAWSTATATSSTSTTATPTTSRRRCTGPAPALAAVDVIDIDSSAATGTEHRIVKVVDAYHERHVEVDPTAKSWTTATA
jgi:hypothetical protein